MKKIYWFIRICIDSVPRLWKVAGYKYFDIGFFYCEDKKSWEAYQPLKEQICKIIDPNFEL